jgi:hypothetical protein
MSAVTISPIAVKYTIDPSTSADDILDELRCLLESSETVLNGNADSLDQIPGGWPALYAIRQCIGLLDALGDRLPPSVVLEAMRGKPA